MWSMACTTQSRYMETNFVDKYFTQINDTRNINNKKRNSAITQLSKTL